MTLCYTLLLLSIALVLWSGILFWGTKRKWRMLVDPPLSLRARDSHSLLKSLFGAKFLPKFNYFMATLLILSAFLLLLEFIDCY
jgi:hypothetical protein